MLGREEITFVSETMCLGEKKSHVYQIRCAWERRNHMCVKNDVLCLVARRFVLCANHMEVKSFLGRFLRRRLIESELRTGIRNNDLNRVVDWIPKVWAHLNKALESHSSADVTIGKFLIFVMSGLFICVDLPCLMFILNNFFKLFL